MVGINHVDIIEIRGGGFISEIHRMLQGQIPDREGLEFGIAGLDAALLFLVQLREADRQLAAAGARRRDDDQRPWRLQVFILAVSFVGYDEGGVGRIAGDRIVERRADTEFGQLLAEGHGRRLLGILRDDHIGDQQAAVAEGVDQAGDILVIGDAEIAADLGFFDIIRIDGNDDLGHVLELLEHADFAVRLEARQDTGGMEVIEQLAAELQIELVVKLADALGDFLRLHGHVTVIVKCDLVHRISPSTDRLYHGTAHVFERISLSAVK